MNRRQFVSLGGWCGPALCLGKLGLRDVAFPFDFSRVTLDGVVHFLRNGFSEGFFPPGPPPFRPECVGMWVLFRGQHTAFAHFNLNDPAVREAFDRKMRRWDAALRGDLGPVTFLRTVTAINPIEELALIEDLEVAIRQRNNRLDYRIAVAVHDQGLAETSALRPINNRVSLWCVEYTEGPEKTLFDRSQQGYSTVVTHCLDEGNWPLTADVPIPRFANFRAKELGIEAPDSIDWQSFPWRSHDNIALIDGVASVGGTCTGVGSTNMVKVNRGCGMACRRCGNDQMHLAGRPKRTERPFTDDEDEVLIVHMYKILSGGDKVEAIEQLANELGRGAFEVICRLEYLTQSSTKITEGVGLPNDFYQN